MTLDEIIETRKLLEANEVNYSGSIFLKHDRFLKDFPKPSNWSGSRKCDDGDVIVYGVYNNQEFFTALTDEEYNAMIKGSPSVKTVAFKTVPDSYVNVKLNGEVSIMIKTQTDGYVIDVYGKNKTVPVGGTWVTLNELGGDSNE